MAKLRQWKKEYGFICTILDKSGTEWDANKRVVECSEEQWFEFVQAHKGFDKKKEHVWPYYEDWCDIFGKDRATGKRSKTWREAAAKFFPEELLNLKDKAKSAALSKCMDVSLRDRLAIGRKLAKDDELSEYFFSLPEHAQKAFVKLELEFLGAFGAIFQG